MQHYGDRGVEAYAKNAKPQGTVSSLIHQRLLDVAADSPLPEDHRAFVMCDYGSADGFNSRHLIADVIGVLKSRSSEQAIQVFYDDVYDADFASLFKMLHASDSYVRRYNDVFTSAIGRSFLEQCLPTGSVHLGISTSAMHWLSEIPCKLKNSITCMSPHCSQQEHEVWHKHAEKEWALNIKHRSKELAPGGCLLVVLANHNPYVLLSLSEQVWISFCQQGIISKEELLNTNQPMIVKTEESILAAFANEKDLQVSLEHLPSFPCRFLQELKEEKDVMAANKKFAVAIVNFLRAIINGVLLSGLKEDRSQQEKVNILDKLFATVSSIIEQDPSKYSSSWNNILVQIHKTK